MPCLQALQSVRDVGTYEPACYLLQACVRRALAQHHTLHPPARRHGAGSAGEDPAILLVMTANLHI